MDYQVKLSRSARADIEDITRYISIDDPEQALRFGQFLIVSITISSRLKSFASGTLAEAVLS